jgi:hypothetical protein
MQYSNSVTLEFSDPCSDRVSSVAQNRLILVRMTRVVASASRGSSCRSPVEDGGSPWRRERVRRENCGWHAMISSLP